MMIKNLWEGWDGQQLNVGTLLCCLLLWQTSQLRLTVIPYNWTARPNYLKRLSFEEKDTVDKYRSQQ